MLLWSRRAGAPMRVRPCGGRCGRRRGCCVRQPPARVSSVACCSRLACRSDPSRDLEHFWVTQAPTRPEYRLTSAQWRTAMCRRLGVGLDFLASGPTDCDCHASHARSVRRDDARVADGDPPKRRLKKPPPVDVRGEHEWTCC
eukprot:COSAG01_NODE_5113_length_4479_cov_201.866971_5_plen_143_part_00